MDNRFFDIESNVYLNSIYILVTLYKSDKPLSMKGLLLSLYLIKNPSICLALLEKKNKILFKKNIQSYELNNIKSEMSKYTSKIYTDGLNEALSFLFSKNIITYEVNSTLVEGSSEFGKIDFKRVPKDLILKASFANKIISNYSIEELESKLNDIWKVII
jgi:oligoribonuclease NrnB/cAMP/cGMP phosphodiesterase (DHH superfamily)